MGHGNSERLGAGRTVAPWDGSSGDLLLQVPDLLPDVRQRLVGGGVAVDRGDAQGGECGDRGEDVETPGVGQPRGEEQVIQNAMVERPIPWWNRIATGLLLVPRPAGPTERSA